MNTLLTTTHTNQEPEDFLRSCGQIMAEFNHSQDSGNWSYGVEANGQRWFVKTAGDRHASHHNAFADRVGWLRNAIMVAGSLSHTMLPALRNVVESPGGPLLVYDWAMGELLYAGHAERSAGQSAHQRFRQLPAATISHWLTELYRLHVLLEQAGWVASDFYDGCLLYDFQSNQLHVIDLDSYHQGPFTNTIGRMFGSTRYMAPEEFMPGAVIDQRTTVFTMGRTALIMLGDGSTDPVAFRGTPSQLVVATRATQPEPGQRYPTMAALSQDWRDATDR